MSQHQGVYCEVDELLRLRFLASGLTLEARKQSAALLDGSVRTRYRGRGMEFAEVRPYQAGDDIRTIDWRVTARMQAPYTKLFQEEHERPVFVMLDQRANMFFGSQSMFKSVYAARLAALIAWIAAQNNDRIGALIFGNSKQEDIRARRGKHAVMELLNVTAQFNQALSTPSMPADAPSLETMLDETSRVAKPGSKIVLISDFHDMDERCRKPLSHLAKRSDVLAIHNYDPLEKALPHNTWLKISDGENRMSVDTASLGEKFSQSFTQQHQYMQSLFPSNGVQYVHAPIDVDMAYFAADLFSAKQGRRNTRGVQGGAS